MRELELVTTLLAQSLPHLRKRSLFNSDSSLDKLIQSIETYFEAKNENIQ